MTVFGDLDPVQLAPTARTRPAQRMWSAVATPRVVRHWRQRYAASLVVSDVIGPALGLLISRLSGLDGGSSLVGARYALACAGVIAVWLSALFVSGAYELRHLSVSVEEYRRVLRGVAVAAGGLALVAVLSDTQVSRQLLLVDTALMCAGLMLARAVVRVIVRVRRRQGFWCDRVVVAGSGASVAELIRVLHRTPSAGLTVVAACVSDDDHPPLSVPIVGNWSDTVEAAERLDADVVAVAGAGRGSRAVRELGWALEGTKRDLVTALELSDVSRARIQITPIGGAPLAWVELPRFSRSGRIVKRAVDILISSVALAIAVPFMLVIGAIVKLTSDGPMLFRQHRLGKGEQLISVLKFRTMVANAEDVRDELIERSAASNLLYFKVHDDPRITSVGCKLRRFSLDELPQLVNVLLGSMSLVGPRPLPGDIDPSHLDYRRRLLVKPGLTGLWQVSGRNDLPAEEALRLDLFYVENWTLGLDLAIIAKTVWAVLTSNGAY